jgi:Tat protein translocase TatB subunit
VANLGGGEILVLLLLALIVLGPQRLPDAAKQVGKFVGEVRRMSNGFQRELRSALDESTEQAARDREAQAAASRNGAEPAAATQAAGERQADEQPAGERATEPATKAAPARRRAEPLRAAGRSGNGAKR